MFDNIELKDHMASESTISSKSAILAEWNMNFPDNILSVGNYRYRKNGTSNYSALPNTFDPTDSGNYYTGATDSDITIDGGTDTTTDLPVFFTSKKQKESLLFSLEDCFGRFRPRSGINKARYGITKFLHHSNSDMFKRPRYYMADRSDNFKYWTSYRTENNKEYGIANSVINGKNYIEDTVPYVVYKEEIPINRVVLKMQTHVGYVNLGPFSKASGPGDDPFFGDSNKSTPLEWKIQALDSKNVWSDIVKFDSTSLRHDGSAIIGADGYVEVSYGLIVPDAFRDTFNLNGEYTSEILLPSQNTMGQAYLIKKNSSELGILKIWSSTRNKYETFTPKYGWYLEDYQAGPTTGFVTSATDHATFYNPADKTTNFKEFKFVKGLRVVVDTMNKSGATLDLIELSPRLAVDLSEKTKSFSVKKAASDLGVSGLPVGQLLASTGSITLFDYDESFSENNIYNSSTNPNGSILAKYASKNLQIKFYEIVENVGGKSIFVPIKTMYAEGFPHISSKDRSVEITLRDLYFYLESITAPELVIPDVSLSYAVATLLDSVGFANYNFKRVAEDRDPIIPFFIVGPKQSVAQVLQNLAISTQTAMFFDEYNNFILMSKNYVMPTTDQRPVDLTLYGSQDTVKYDTDRSNNSEYSGKKYKVLKGKRSGLTIANIADIASQDNNVYNDGKISYTTRYIQKSYGTLKQSYLLDKDKKWIYKPALLWEVSGTGNTKSVNEEISSQNKYNLAAIPLNSDITADVPVVLNGAVINNIIDLGEAVYWMPRYTGYFYANGEIIKFDAVEYNVASVGNVWITSVQDYQKYFSKISFNGKIYPTGRVRIYSEPNYETNGGVTSLRSGAVVKHGRGQFGTDIVAHNSGLDSYWVDAANIKGVNMASSLLFNPTTTPTTKSGAAGISDASGAARAGVIKNFLSQSFNTESDILNSLVADSQTVQASALVLTGPSFTTNQDPQDFLSYIHKPLATTTVDATTQKVTTVGTSFKHFGTRMRVIGQIQNDKSKVQTAIGATKYFEVTPENADAAITISGGGGGLAVLLNPLTNEGYYFEITALSEANMDQFSGADNVKNVMFYKIARNNASTLDSDKAVPLLLNIAGTTEKWSGGLAQILVDDGRFTGQSRVVSQEKNTVYDLSVEYRDVNGVRRFFLYLNNTQIATLDDPNPLPISNNMAVFVRGGSKCMFENLYALAGNYADNSAVGLDTVTSSSFGDPKVLANDSFRKYAISGLVQSSYLSGISPASTPKHSIYYEEFGTIMREAAYFNVKYDKAFPALYSKISPTFNGIRGYTVSGFHGGSYGAEFLVFNATDTSLNLDETSGNYLRIQGITFTQASQVDLTVDEYFSEKSDFSNPQVVNSAVIESPLKFKNDYYDIKTSRMTYGKNEFNLDATYIQSQDAATEMMGWLTSKIMKPRKSIGVKIFANPMIQLGDIVNIDYVKNGVDQLVDIDTRFIVYNIEYSKSIGGPEMTIYLSEVV